MKAYQQVTSFGPDAAFLANVILTRHSKPAQKLSIVLFLLRRGHSVHVAQFDADTLIIDGFRCAWSDLDTKHPVLFERQLNTNVRATQNTLTYSCGCSYPTNEPSHYYDHHCATCHRELWSN